MVDVDTHQKGDIAELAIAFEAVKLGYSVSFPYGHNNRYDLIVDRNEKLERVQVKYVNSDGITIKISCRSVNKENGKLVKHKYTKNDIEWLAVFDSFDNTCYFIPSEELNDGMDTVILRIEKPKNNQKKLIRWAKDYIKW